MRGDNRAFQWSPHLSLFAICTNRSLATYWLKCLSFRSFILHHWHQWKFATDTVDGEWEFVFTTVLYQSKPGFNCFSISYSHNLLDCFSVMTSRYFFITELKFFCNIFSTKGKNPVHNNLHSSIFGISTNNRQYTVMVFLLHFLSFEIPILEFLWAPVCYSCSVWAAVYVPLRIRSEISFQILDHALASTSYIPTQLKYLLPKSMPVTLNIREKQTSLEYLKKFGVFILYTINPTSRHYIPRSLNISR